jgi:hypothetical protein
MGKITRTWSLMSASWQILKQDTEMLLFPLISGLCCLVVMASFAVPLWLTGAWQPPGEQASAQQQIAYYAILFLFYFCNYFVIVFFNAAIVACATIRLGGGNPTVADGLRSAAQRLPLIAGWALLSATVGLVLRIIEDRSEKVGRFVAGLLGMAWTVVSFLVIPILVVERKSPVAALKDSTALLRRTWGEQLVGNFSFGLIFFLLAIPAFALIALGIFAGSLAIAVLCIGLAVVYLVLLALIQSALQSIFQAALYLYARQGQVPAGFQHESLAGALAQK